MEDSKTGDLGPDVADFLKIESHLARVYAHKGNAANFLCTVSANACPEFTWFKDGIKIETEPRVRIGSHSVVSPEKTTTFLTLSIEELGSADQGIYTCICRNRSKQVTIRADLFVSSSKLKRAAAYYKSTNDSVRVLRHLRNVNIEAGRCIELKVAFLKGAYFVVWYRNNKRIDLNDRMIMSESSEAETVATLTVLDSTTSDSGLYFVMSRTIEGIVQSSFAEVHVTPKPESEIEDKDTPENLTQLPIIVEMPTETGTFEKDVLRVTCKVDIDIHTIIEWQKDGISIDNNSHFVAVDYGDQYIGLRVDNSTMEDTGEYTLTLRDQQTGNTVSSSCYVIITPMNHNECAPAVSVQRPLQSAVACVGTKVVFDCSFALEDPSYFFVVWYVGAFKIERSNRKFSVIYRGGEYLLYIKQVELDMAGPVVCELRKALPNQKTVPVGTSTAHLTIIPAADEVSLDHVINKHCQQTRVYDKSYPCPSIRNSNDKPNLHEFRDDNYLDISYCQLDEDGLYYLYASKEDRAVSIMYMEQTPESDGELILWDTNDFPENCWFAVSVGQFDGSYIESGKSSTPGIGIKNPIPYALLQLRVKAIPNENLASSLIYIERSTEPVIKPAKSERVRQMDDFMANYTESGDLLGFGAFGSVVLVRDNEGLFYAAKIIKTEEEKQRRQAQREYDTMRQLRHPKLIQSAEAFAGENCFVIVMEHIWGGELFDRIVLEEHISEEDVVNYVKQLCEALLFLHQRRIVHLDVKPENILCLSPNSCHVKLIDFGLATALGGPILRKMYGTRDYMAPEVLNYNGLDLVNDMWSVGVVTYTLLSGNLPFGSGSWVVTAGRITSASYDYSDVVFNDVSQLAKDFVDHLLVLNTTERMSSERALQHPWLKVGPPRDATPGCIPKRTRENMKTYLATHRARWRKAGQMMMAAHRIRARAIESGVKRERWRAAVTLDSQNVTQKGESLPTDAQ